MNSRIVCIGNRFVAGDIAGIAVHNNLQNRDLPDDIQLIEGGLAGLNLLPLLEEGGRVVFVDTVSGFTGAGNIVVLDWESLLAKSCETEYGHEAGLPYLLSVLPHVCEGELPEEIMLVGLEGVCSDQLIDEAATLSVEIASNGLRLKDAGRYNS